MSRTLKKRRRKASRERMGTPSAASRPRTCPLLLVQLVLRLGKTLIGVLPCSRRIRAANDPKA